MKELKELLDRLWIPEAEHFWRGLSIYPIYRRPGWEGRPRCPLPYEVLSEALKIGAAKVRELERPTVPQLMVEYRGQSLVLGIDGDELVGGMQNRVLNSSVLLRPGSTPVPVSCVEQRRWRMGEQAGFRGGERLPHGVRVASHGHVARSLHNQGGHASDQRAVWQQIAQGHGAPSSALHDWYRARDRVLQEYVEHLPYPAHAVGMVVGIGGALRACDLFDQPRTAEIYWSRLIRSSATEALQWHQHRHPKEPAENLLLALRHCQFESFESPGAGSDLRIQGPALSGSALLVQDVLVHLSLFREAL